MGLPSLVAEKLNLNSLEFGWVRQGWFALYASCAVSLPAQVDGYCDVICDEAPTNDATHDASSVNLAVQSLGFGVVFAHLFTFYLFIYIFLVRLQ